MKKVIAILTLFFTFIAPSCFASAGSAAAPANYQLSQNAQMVNAISNGQFNDALKLAGGNVDSILSALISEDTLSNDKLNFGNIHKAVSQLVSKATSGTLGLARQTLYDQTLRLSIQAGEMQRTGYTVPDEYKSKATIRAEQLLPIVAAEIQKRTPSTPEPQRPESVTKSSLLYPYYE